MLYRLFIFFTIFQFPYLLSAIEIIPTPQEVKELPETLRLENFSGMAIESFQTIEDHPIGRTIINEIGICNNEVFSATSGTLLPVSLSIDSGGSLHKEGYHLNISDQSVVIEGKDHAGLLYGVQTLLQLLYAHIDQGVLTGVDIVDYPDFTFRGVFDDISRGPLPNMNFMKKQIRRFARLKINVMAFYIEHVLRTEKHDDFAPPEALTINELQELSDYAAGYNIQFMGSFQSLGHFRNVLKSPEYAHLGVSDRMLDPGSSASIQFLTEVYDEIIPTASHPIFNINCDETYDLARGARLKQLSDSIGEGGVYAQHVSPLLEHVKEKGKRPGMWGDVLLHHPQVFDQIPEETVIFTWDYSEREDFSAWIDPIVGRGFDFVACTGILNSYRLWPDLAEAHGNIRSFSREAYEKGGLGVLTTVWDDGGRHFFTCDWQGIAFASEYSWNPDGADDSSLKIRYSDIFLHDETDQFSSLISKLEALQSTDRLHRLDNTLINTRYTAKDNDPIFIDTSELTQIITHLVGADQRVDKLYTGAGINSFDWRSDNRVWQFEVHQLLEATQMPLRLIELRKTYEEIILSGTKANRQKLERLIEYTARNELVWQKIHDDFISLWKNENRAYWLDEAIKPYKDKILTWQQIKEFLQWVAIHGVENIPEDVRLNFDYRASPGFFITYWLGAGPFTAEGSEPLATDYFSREGGEKNLRPGAIDYFLTQEDSYKGWDKIISDHPSEMYFSDFYDDAGKNVAYASIRFEIEEETSVDYELKCSGSFNLFLDSEKLQTSHTDQSTYKGKLHLKKGKNYLLFKMVEPKSKPWKFSMQILHDRMRYNKYKYYVR